jgi:excisionase family DNA binding protein
LHYKKDCDILYLNIKKRRHKMAQTPNLLTIKESADALRMTDVWLRKKIHEGKIKFIMMGGKYFISKNEIERCRREGVEK